MGDDQTQSNATTAEVHQCEQDFARALVSGDLNAVDQFLADEFAFVGPTGVMSDKQAFMSQLRSGDLVYTSMSINDLFVRSYGDVALAFDNSLVQGRVKGHEFSGRFRGIDVLVRREGRWQFAATQETTVQPPPSGPPSPSPSS